MRSQKRVIKSIIFILILITVCTTITFGNAAEPPKLIIKIPSSKSIDITLINAKEDLWETHTSKLFEQYYTYRFHEESRSTYEFEVTTANKKFIATIDEPIQEYHTTYVLDVKGQKLIKGDISITRKIFYALFRLLVTLFFEGIFFYAFGYRKKHSWKVFLYVNLLTQGALNVWISTVQSYDGYSLIFGLFFYEICILIFELLAYNKFIKEQSKIVLYCYVIISNLASLLLGGNLLLRYLPY